MKRTPGLLCCILLTVVGGCAERSQEPDLTSANIAFQDWVGYGLFYLAQEKGFCKEEGLELVFINEQLDSARRDAFNQGMLDFEAATLDLLVSKAAEGAPVAAILEIDQSSGSDALVADQSINSLEALAGRRLTLTRDDVGETFIATLFYRKAIPFDGLELVPRVPEEVVPTFVNGEADACVTREPHITEALQRPGAHILATTKETPGIIIYTLNARMDLVENNPELIRKVLRAWFKGLAYYREHPVEASEIIAKYYSISPEQYRDQVEGMSWESYEQQKVAAEYQEWVDAFDAISTVKLAHHRIPRRPDSTKAINHTFIENLYEDSQ